MRKKRIVKYITFILTLSFLLCLNLVNLYSEEVKIGEVPEENGYYTKEINGKTIFFIRNENKVYALNYYCTYDGILLNFDNNLKQHLCNECESRYNIIGIKMAGSVSRRSLDRYKIKIKNNNIYIDDSIIYREGDNEYNNAFALVL